MGSDAAGVAFPRLFPQHKSTHAFVLRAHIGKKSRAVITLKEDSKVAVLFERLNIYSPEEALDASSYWTIVVA